MFYGEKIPLPRALEMGMSAAIVEFGDAVPPTGKEAKGIDRVCMALAAYFEKYDPATDYLQPRFAPNGKPMVEFTFSVPLPRNHPISGEPLIYAGRFDMVGLYQGQQLGVDEKTTSQLGPTWKNKWNLRSQFTGYTWAMQQYGFPVVGCLVRGVSFLKNSFGFEESLQLRPQYMIDSWYSQLLANIDQMLVAWETGWYNQDFGDTCAEYSGCPFQKLCTSPQPENWVGSYGTRKWDPLKKVPYVQPETKVETVEAPDELLRLVQG